MVIFYKTKEPPPYCWLSFQVVTAHRWLYYPVFSPLEVNASQRPAANNRVTASDRRKFVLTFASDLRALDEIICLWKTAIDTNLIIPLIFFSLLNFLFVVTHLLPFSVLLLSLSSFLCSVRFNFLSDGYNWDFFLV